MDHLISSSIKYMNNIFFVRHENDLEFMMPLIINNGSSFIVVYGDLGKEAFKRIELNNIDYVSIYKSSYLLTFLYRFLYKFTKGIIHENIIKYYNSIFINSTKIILTKYIKEIPLDMCQSVLFDHTSSEVALSLIELLKDYKKRNSLKFKLVSVPHGVGTIVNTMCDYINTEPVILKGFNVYDLIVCNDRQQFDTFVRSGISAEKLITIGSLRYTKKWVKQLLQKSQVVNSTTDETNILIVHTKFMGNINAREVERCLSVLNNFDGFNIRIKSHPRGGLKEAMALAKCYKDVDVVTEDVVGNIAWSDYVVFFGSSVVYDAFILDKPVLFPSYAVTNQLSEEILNGVVCLNTPDDFYKAIDEIFNGADVGLNYEYHNNYKKIMKSWEEALV